MNFKSSERSTELVKRPPEAVSALNSEETKENFNRDERKKKENFNRYSPRGFSASIYITLLEQ